MGLPTYAYSPLLESDPVDLDLIVPDRSSLVPWPSPETRGPHFLVPFYNSGATAPMLKGVIVIIPSVNESAKGSNYGDDFVFERTWVYPALIQMGFIVEESTRTIKIWNADRYQSVDVTAIVADAADGTSLASNPLPDTIATFYEADYVLTILKIGPPLQDATYTFTIGGVEFATNITGVRVIAFPVNPNWDQGIEQKYTFQSTIFTSKRLKEQRRPLKEISAFSSIFNIDLTAVNRQTIINLISYGKDKVFGVPIFSEMMTPTTITTGTSVIIISEDTANYYNLNNRVNYVIICNFEDGVGEVKKFSSVSGSQINLDQDIVGSFTVGKCWVFACAFCFMRAYKGSNLTDDMENIKVSFEEFVLE